MTTGCSRTPLVQKLGIREGMSLAVLSAPPGFVDTLAPLPDRLSIVGRLVGHRDLVLIFVVHRVDETWSGLKLVIRKELR